MRLILKVRISPRSRQKATRYHAPLLYHSRMRPASHMPEAEMMTLGVSMKLISLDSSLVTDSFSPANEMGLMPSFTSS